MLPICRVLPRRARVPRDAVPVGRPTLSTRPTPEAEHGHGHGHRHRRSGRRGPARAQRVESRGVRGRVHGLHVRRVRAESRVRGRVHGLRRLRRRLGWSGLLGRSIPRGRRRVPVFGERMILPRRGWRGGRRGPGRGALRRRRRGADGRVALFGALDRRHARGARGRARRRRRLRGEHQVKHHRGLLEIRSLDHVRQARGFVPEQRPGVHDALRVGRGVTLVLRFDLSLELAHGQREGHLAEGEISLREVLDGQAYRRGRRRGWVRRHGARAGISRGGRFHALFPPKVRHARGALWRPTEAASAPRNSSGTRLFDQ